MKVAAVVDTGPLIYLAELDSLALLSLPQRLYIPEEVYGELETGGVPQGLEDVEHTIVAGDAGTIDDGSLDPGESAALAVAKDRQAVLLTDDLDARERAVERDVEVHGTIGIIATGYAQGLIDRDEAARRMRMLQHETRLYVTSAVVERSIEMLGDDQ